MKVFGILVENVYRLLGLSGYDRSLNMLNGFASELGLYWNWLSRLVLGFVRREVLDEHRALVYHT